MSKFINKLFEAFMIIGGLVGEIIGVVFALIATFASIAVMVMILLDMASIPNELLQRLSPNKDEERAGERPKQIEKTAAKDQNSRKDVAPAKS